MSDIKPELGMGATENCWSDRHAYTIVGILKGGEIMVQRDAATVIKGSTQDGSAEYKYEADPNGATRILTKRTDGRWRAKGDSKKGNTYTLGIRNEHRDPHF